MTHNDSVPTVSYYTNHLGQKAVHLNGVSYAIVTLNLCALKLAISADTPLICRKATPKSNFQNGSQVVHTNHSFGTCVLFPMGGKY